MENNRNFPARQFHSLTFFAGLCIGITPVAQALAAEGQTNADDTLVVEASTPSLYAPQQSADPKFSRPVADTTRTMTVISEQVIKDQGATNLTDALKNVPGVGAFFAGENGNSTTGDAIYMRGADTSNSIYIDGIRDIGSVSRDTFNTEQVEVIKGPSGTDYGRSAPTGSINMISKQPRNDSGIDASASIGSAWFRRGTLDVNQVIGDTTAVRLNVMGEKTHDAGRDKVKNERYGVAPSVAFGLGTANRLYLNYLHVTQHNTPDGGIPTIGLPGYSAPSAGTAALNHSGKVDTHNFYGTDSDYDDSTTDTATMRFEHDINDNTTIRNTTRWSRVKQDYLMTAIMGGASNITQPTSDVNSWTWSRTANTKDVSNKILTNQTNLTSTFYTGSIGHDVSTGVEFTRETQTNYGVNPVTLPAVNIYHPDSSIHPGGLTRNGANANGQTDTFAIYAFDTLQATIKNGKDVAQDGSSSLPYTPEHAFTLWSQYQATDDISVGAGARYIGSMHKGSDGAVGTPAFTEGYWVADAKLGYRVNRNLDFQLNVYNLFDTDYVASINKSGYRYHPGEPRTFLLTANMHF